MNEQKMGIGEGSATITASSCAPVTVVPLVEELVLEASIVPARRGELYAEAANRIRDLESALHRVIDADDIRTARKAAHSVLLPSGK